MCLFPPALEGQFFSWIYSSRMSSLPVAPHTVQHQDHSAQAVTGNMGRAEDLAECSCFVLPSGYLERQGKTKWVVGGRAWNTLPQEHKSHSLGLTCPGHFVCVALCKKQVEATGGTWLNQAWGGELFLLPVPDPACIAYALAHEVSQQHQGTNSLKKDFRSPENTLPYQF